MGKNSKRESKEKKGKESEEKKMPIFFQKEREFHMSLPIEIGYRFRQHRNKTTGSY